MSQPARSVSEGDTLTRSVSEGNTLARSVSEGHRPLPLRVVKVGGSLLDWPELPATLQRWLTTQPPAIHILVCGGGALVEALRTADRALSISAGVMHWLAIDAMSITARLLAAMLRESPPCERYADLLAWRRESKAPQTIVFDVRQFLRDHEPLLPGEPLPWNWSATSDSIAARLAEALGADELILLKSADPPATELDQLAAANYVDPHFARAAAALNRVSLVNLRQAFAAHLPFAATA